MMIMSRTCYYGTNDGLFNIMMMHDAKLLYEHDELLYISVGEMNMVWNEVKATSMWCMWKVVLIQT